MLLYNCKAGGTEREFDMSRMLYRVISSDVLFNGADNIMNIRKDPNYRYEGDDPEMKLIYRIFENRSL